MEVLGAIRETEAHDFAYQVRRTQLFFREGALKALALSLWLVLSAIPALAQTTTAVPTPSSCGATAVCRGAPAPLIGAGIPVAVAIGGVLLGAKILKRRRK